MTSMACPIPFRYPEAPVASGRHLLLPLAPALNSGVNRRRARLPADLVCMLDIISTFQIVSTKAGECQDKIPTAEGTTESCSAASRELI